MQENLFQQKFNPIELSHKNLVGPVLIELAPLLAGYTFASFMSWKPIFQYEWALFQNKSLIISAYIPEQKVRHILQPLGDFSKECQEMMLNEMSRLDYQLKIYGTSSTFIERFPEFISHFEIKNDPGLANYIYRAEDLALLPGRKYAKKRNLISQADNSYSWVSSSITDNCLPECINLLEQIANDDQIEKDQSLINERLALDYTLHHFKELNQKGHVIKVNDKPVAFSIYEELNPSTAVVHFEKADRNLKGLYQLINRETSKAIFESGYELINREEDINLPGLRKAKQSYYPVELRPAYQLVYKK
jgi:uncharacterized protein